MFPTYSLCCCFYFHKCSRVNGEAQQFGDYTGYYRLVSLASLALSGRCQQDPSDSGMKSSTNDNIIICCCEKCVFGKFFFLFNHIFIELKLGRANQLCHSSIQFYITLTFSKGLSFLSLGGGGVVGRVCV